MPMFNLINIDLMKRVKKPEGSFIKSLELLDVNFTDIRVPNTRGIVNFAHNNVNIHFDFKNIGNKKVFPKNTPNKRVKSVQNKLNMNTKIKVFVNINTQKFNAVNNFNLITSTLK